MKLALIGDPHFANKKLFGSPTGIPGVNGRLQNTINVFEWILNDLPPDVQEVCILGDITHEHGHLTPPVLNEVRNLFHKFNEEGRNLTILSGNHDIDSNNSSIIRAFENYNSNYEAGVETVTKFRQIYWGYPVPVYAIPYCSHDETIKALKQIEQEYKITKTRCIVLMHHHFEGAVHGAHEFEPPGGINPKNIPACVLMVLSGHYHTAQQIDDRISYIGVPVQQDFGEAANKPMYWILDIANDGLIEIEQREILAGARFHILPHNFDLHETLPGDPQKDYYRIDLPTDVDPAVISDLIAALTNVIVKPIPIEVELRSRVSEVLQEEGQVTVKDAIKAYALMNAEAEKVEGLVALADDIIKASKA